MFYSKERDVKLRVERRDMFGKYKIMESLELEQLKRTIAKDGAGEYYIKEITRMLEGNIRAIDIINYIKKYLPGCDIQLNDGEFLLTTKDGNDRLVWELKELK